MSGGGPAIFLDRDGVLNATVVREGRPYPPANVDELVVSAADIAAVRRLRSLGLPLHGCTNQPDVARGTTPRATVEAINNRLMALMPLDSIEVCWHDDKDGCACRKPLPGLLTALAKRHGYTLSESWMIGDRWRDVACGAAAGCTTIFIDYGYREDYRAGPADFTVSSLTEAVDIVARHATRSALAALAIPA